MILATIDRAISDAHAAGRTGAIELISADAMALARALATETGGPVEIPLTYRGRAIRIVKRIRIREE